MLEPTIKMNYAVTDITDIVQIKQHPDRTMSALLERLNQMKASSAVDYGIYLDIPDDQKAQKDEFYEQVYLDHDELLRAVEWLVREVKYLRNCTHSC